jgi:hypothetical protein
LFNTCIQNDSSNIELDREKAEVGNVESAIHYLLKDYEAYGDAVVRTLAVEVLIITLVKHIKHLNDSLLA